MRAVFGFPLAQCNHCVLVLEGEGSSGKATAQSWVPPRTKTRCAAAPVLVGKLPWQLAATASSAPSSLEPVATDLLRLTLGWSHAF